jgi:hypothetical protein
MNFNLQNALRDLSHWTPAYLRQEIFSHGDLTVRNAAIKVLTELDSDPEHECVRLLSDMLRTIPEV